MTVSSASVSDISIFYKTTAHTPSGDESSSLSSSHQQLSKTDHLAVALRTLLLQHKAAFIQDCALSPKKAKIWRKIHTQLKKQAPTAFKGMQKHIIEIHNLAKQTRSVLKACQKHGVQLGDYHAFLQDFDGNIHGSGFETTPLIKAVSQKNYRMVKVLHQLNVSLHNFDADNWTPISKAISQNDGKMVRLLIKCGLNINALNEIGETPLIYAIRANRPEMVRLLIALKASLEIENCKHLTPIQVAIDNHLSNMVALLVELGLNLNAISKGKKSPLTYAVARKNAPMVEALVKLKADVNLIDGNGKTPLNVAIFDNNGPMVTLLVELKADVNKANHKGHTPLTLAAKHDRLDILLFLGYKKAVLSQHNFWGQSPLHTAVRAEKSNSVNLLLKLGANIDIRNKFGFTPLAEALLAKNTGIANILKQAGADQVLAKKMQMTFELAHVWGVPNKIVAFYHRGKKIKLHLQSGMLTGLGLLKHYAHEFFKTIQSDEEHPLSSQDRTAILEALSNAYPLVNMSNKDIVEYIQKGKPFLIEGGTAEHAIAMVFCHGNLIVCNRGYGRDKLASVIYTLPAEKLTPQLIADLKFSYKSVKGFKKMIKALKLTRNGGYQHKDQSADNCTWASDKAALGAIFRQYEKAALRALIRHYNEKNSNQIYKEFTAFTREYSLEMFLQTCPHEKSILKLIYKKLKNKPGLFRAKKMLAAALSPSACEFKYESKGEAE